MEERKEILHLQGNLNAVYMFQTALFALIVSLGKGRGIKPDALRVEVKTQMERLMRNHRRTVGDAVKGGSLSNDDASVILAASEEIVMDLEHLISRVV